MKVLFLQEPESLSCQRPLVDEALADLERAEVAFASSTEEARRHPDTEAVIAPTMRWLSDALGVLPRVKWIHFLSAGVDRIWGMPFDKKRYLLSKSTGVHADTAAEYVLGAVLYALKGFGIYSRQQQQREWRRIWLDESAGKTLAIVGVGAIGSRVGSLAKTLGMRVVGMSSAARDLPHVDAVFDRSNLEGMLQEADFIVLTVPLTENTRGLFGGRQFEAMKETAWLINVARGGVVDERALIAALRENSIGGAVLDVFENEPLPPSSPLWALDNVLITPHVAGSTQHYIPRAMDVFKENYRSLAASGELVTPVDVAKGY